ncbi:HNH endonuclease signature motif containing protein [Isoptericola croceus]|uniref:HNH endonuclease signature motif containing protein n=1 Tax=Isoptericola croceus TaxID=3031406 RepID=UPI0023F9A323|nr:HNH endonuclease signature motif containing protein [Isoptericola croceus]
MNGLPLPALEPGHVGRAVVDYLVQSGLVEDCDPIANMILEAYRQYHANLGGVGGYVHPTFDRGTADALRAGYDALRDLVKFSEFKSAIRATVHGIGDWCPVCGLSVASTIDHFAPKRGAVNYPELAFYALNLVPMCDVCNRKKGSLTAESPRRIAFPHLYFDYAHLSRIELVAEVRFSGGHPYVVFDVELDSDLPEEFRKAVLGSVDRLDLVNRWSISGQAELLVLLHEYAGLVEFIGGPGVLRVLRNRATGLRQVLGKVSYRAAVADAAAESNALWDPTRNALLVTDVAEGLT